VFVLSYVQPAKLSDCSGFCAFLPCMYSPSFFPLLTPFGWNGCPCGHYSVLMTSPSSPAPAFLSGNAFAQAPSKCGTRQPHPLQIAATPSQSTPAYRSTTMLIAATTISAAMSTITVIVRLASPISHGQVPRVKGTHQSIPDTPHASCPPDPLAQPADPQSHPAALSAGPPAGPSPGSSSPHRRPARAAAPPT